MDDLTFSTQNQILHHGIQGQKWGIQNGPPYPLDKTTAKEVKKQAKQDLKNTEAVKRMNKGTMIGAAVGQFLGGPIGAGAGASIGQVIAFNHLSPELKDEYYSKVENYTKMKDQYKLVKKYEKMSMKEISKEEKQAKKMNKENKNQSTSNSNVTQAEKEVRDEIRKKYSGNGNSSISNSDLKKLAAAEIKNPKVKNAEGKPYTSVDEYIRDNGGLEQFRTDTASMLF